jgi:hypothetical protein
MFQHPDYALAHAHERRRELVARADRYRVFAAIRRRTRVQVTPAVAPQC